MEPEELLIAMKEWAQRVNITGLVGVSYPPLNHIPQSPWLMLRQARDDSGVFVQRTGAGQRVDVPVEAILLITAQGDQPREEARLDPLVPQVVDTFDPGAWDMDIADMLGLESSEIEHVFTEARFRREPVQWGQQECFAAYITFDAVIRRTPKALPLKGVHP